MYPIYEVGPVNGAGIRIKVSVGTPGTAFTNLHHSPPAGQWNRFPDTNSQNGSIDTYQLGLAENLRNQYLLIRTLVDFSNIDKSLWKGQRLNLYIKYELSGGATIDGRMDVLPGEIISSKEGKILEINKIILLK